MVRDQLDLQAVHHQVELQAAHRQVELLAVHHQLEVPVVDQVEHLMDLHRHRRRRLVVLVVAKGPAELDKVIRHFQSSRILNSFCRRFRSQWPQTTISPLELDSPTFLPNRSYPQEEIHLSTISIHHDSFCIFLNT